MSNDLSLDYGELDFFVLTDNPADLAAFTPGTYVVEIWGGDGVPQTYSIDLTGDMPLHQPLYDHTPGASTGWRPEISWSDPNDPNVNVCVFEIQQYDDDLGGFDDEVWL